MSSKPVCSYLHSRLVFLIVMFTHPIYLKLPICLLSSSFFVLTCDVFIMCHIFKKNGARVSLSFNQNIVEKISLQFCLYTLIVLMHWASVERADNFFLFPRPL